MKTDVGEPASPLLWAVVANVVTQKTHGPDPRPGTKHFAPGTKVWCFPVIWGDGGDRLQVLGQHRGSRKAIGLVMDSRDLENFRAKGCYSPGVAARLQDYWKSRTREDAESMAKSFNERKPRGK